MEEVNMEERHIEKSSTHKKDMSGGNPYTRGYVYEEGTYKWRGNAEYIAYITSDGKSHVRVV